MSPHAPGPLGPPDHHTESLLGVPVERGPAPGPWDAPVQWRGVLWADESKALLRVGPVGLWVQDGERVVLEVERDEDLSRYDFVVYASGLRLLLTQRRRFTLHATLVVSPDGRMVAVAGDSMAGKSSTVMALVAGGWTFACDDLVEVGPGAVAVPWPRPVHLSDAAARLLGGDPAVGRELPGRTKRAYHLAADLTPRPLAAVVHLTADAALPGDQPVAERLDPVRALVQLAAIGERTGLVELPALRADYLAWVGELVRTVPVVAVRRPGGADTIAAVVDLVRGALATATNGLGRECR